MRLGFNGASTMKTDLPGDIRVASEAGYDLIEFWAKKMTAYLSNHTLEDVKGLLKKAKVKPLAINSVEFITFNASWEKINTMNLIRKYAKIAETLKCPYIVLVPSPRPTDVSDQDVFAESVAVLKEISDKFKDYKVLALASFEYMDSKVQNNLLEFAREGGIVILGPKIPSLNAQFQKEDILKKNLSSKKMVKITLNGKTAGFRYETGNGSIIHLLELDKKKIGKTLDVILKNESVLKLEKNNPRADVTLHRNVKDAKHAIIFVANPTSQSIQAEVKLEMVLGSAKEIWKNRRVEIKNEKLVDKLPPYTIMMYECVSG